MVSRRHLNRRAFLSCLSAGIVGVAGCTAADDSPEQTGSPTATNGTGTPGPTDSPADLPSPNDTNSDPTGTDTDTPRDSPGEPPTGTGEPDPWTGIETGSVLDSFDAFEEQWDVVDGSAATSGDIVYGDGTALYLRTDGSKRATIQRSFDTARDFSNTHFSMAFRLEGSTAGLIQPNLILRDLFGNRRFLSGAVQAQANDRWVRLDLGVNEDQGADMRAIKQIRVHLWDGNDITRFFVDDIRTHEAPETGFVMFTFDDAHPRDYSVAYPTLREHGFAGACFPVGNRLVSDSDPTIAQYLEMQDAGWDIGAHTTSHQHLPEYSRREQRLILERNKQQLLDNGFSRGARFFRAPYGGYGSNTLDLLPQFFDMSFAGAGSANGVNPTVTDPRTVGLKIGDDYARTKSLIDAAAEYKLLLGLTIHMSNVENRQAFENLISYTADQERQGRIEVITPSTLLDEGS